MRWFELGATYEYFLGRQRRSLLGGHGFGGGSNIRETRPVSDGGVEKRVSRDRSGRRVVEGRDQARGKSRRGSAIAERVV